MMDKTNEMNAIHLETKIRITEDVLLRTKSVYKQQEISENLQKMRAQLQRMQYGKNRASN